LDILIKNNFVSSLLNKKHYHVLNFHRIYAILIDSITFHIQEENTIKYGNDINLEDGFFIDKKVLYVHFNHLYAKNINHYLSFLDEKVNPIIILYYPLHILQNAFIDLFIK